MGPTHREMKWNDIEWESRAGVGFLCTVGTEFLCWDEDFRAGLKECHEGYFQTGQKDKRENLLWKCKFATKNNSLDG